MTKRRLAILFGALCFLLMVDLLRVFLISQNQEYSQRAGDQVVTELVVEQARGTIYDRNGIPLTGGEAVSYALCVPGEDGYTALYPYLSAAGQETLYARRNSAAPFLLRLAQDATTADALCFTGQTRYFALPIAEHLIGYLDGSGQAVSGLEKAYDSLLRQAGDKTVVHCVTTAQGELLEGEKPYAYTQPGSGQGLMLTLDAGIQRACEGVAQAGMTTGCILVLERQSGKVLADVSMPQFDPGNVAKSIQAQDTSLIDRALAQYNVGSVFKPVLAAAALENGLGWYGCQCAGAVEVDGQTYRCAKSIAHGSVDLRIGLEESCNCYFIRLGQLLGGEPILAMARALGFGQALPVAEGLSGGSGNLPEARTLQNSGQLANFSFGQGQLLATPLQVAGMMNCIANEGLYQAPQLLEGITDKDGTVTQSLAQSSRTRAMSRQTAQALQQMLAGVVTEGIGTEAQTLEQDSAGKTGTAQTGRMDEQGKELMDYWFAGFYPAQEPRYTVVVLQDGMREPQVSCAALFARVCNTISLLENG